MTIEESLWTMFGRGATVMTYRFYESHLPKHPELMRHFKDIGPKQQAALLAVGLAAVVQNHLRPVPAVEKYLATLGQLHRRRNIPRDAYAEFADALIETLQTFCRSEWDTELERDWRTALASASERMLREYPS